MRDKIIWHKRTIVPILISLLLIPSCFFQTAFAESSNSIKLTEDQKIFHVLNRLGFGPRPGDVKKVKEIGLRNYIESQLYAEKIEDSSMAVKLKNLSLLNFSNSQIFERYPNPGVLNQLIRNYRQEQTADAPVSVGSSDSEASMNREKILELSKKHGFRRPAEITRQLNASRILRAVYSEHQLQEVMVDFWSNHFNVYANKQLVRWYLPEYDRDVIRPNVLGNFKDLLLATAKSPAMLYYLDNFQSVTPRYANSNRGGLNSRQIENIRSNPQARERIKRNRNLTDQQLDQIIKTSETQISMPQQPRRGINENYAREIMELHTLGVDGGYTQKDIQEVAKAFTGWTIADPRGLTQTAEIIDLKDNRPAPRRVSLPASSKTGEFIFQIRDHDNSEKIVLGKKINRGGINDGLDVIDLLANHPSTARSIAKKLAVKFISDDPGEDTIDQIAAAFIRSKGDIRITLRAVFESEEFFSPKNYRAKIKTPFEVAISAIRAVGADTNGLGGIQQLLNQMGEPLYNYQAPTGYPDTAEDWVNTGAMLERINYAVAIASSSIPGTRTDISKIKADSNSGDLLASLLILFLNGEMSESSKIILKTQMSNPLPKANIKQEANNDDRMPNEPAETNMRLQQVLTDDIQTVKIISLIIGSPEFQRQ